MLPPTSVLIPPALRISPASVVVVVFPLEPVIATIGPGRCRAASSISPMTGSPAPRACTSGGASTGTPGLTTIRSWPRNVRSPWPPVSTVMPWSSRIGISSRSWSGDLVSETVTRAPRSLRNRAAATPDLPSPTTRTRLSLRSTGVSFTTETWKQAEKRGRLFPLDLCSHGRFSSQFQSGQGEQREDQRRDPEADDHFRFRPSQQLEMVMDGRHLENSFLAELVTCNLQNDGEGFDHEDSPDKGQQQLLLDHDSDRADGAAQGEASNIAHKDFRGMGVVPQESDGRAHHGTAENRQFADLRHTLQFEVGGEGSVPADIGQDRQRTGGDHGASDGEAVQSVGEVDGIA